MQLTLSTAADDTPPATTQRLSHISFLLPAGGAAFIFPNTSVYPEATQRISSRPGMMPSVPLQVICSLPGIWGWGNIVLLRPCGLSHGGQEGAACPGSQVIFLLLILWLWRQSTCTNHVAKVPDRANRKVQDSQNHYFEEQLGTGHPNAWHQCGVS